MNIKYFDALNADVIGTLRKLRSLKKVNQLGFKSDLYGKVPANMFLLTHKCGNNYVDSVFQSSKENLIQYQSDELRDQMPGPYIRDMDEVKTDFANIRCRNFTPLSIEKSLRQVDLSRSHFFLFVRHPASFFRSAVTYHLCGKEMWARTNTYSYLGGKTLSQALNEAQDIEARLIISMNHFGLLWGLPDNWVKCYRYLTQLGANFTVVKTEDLFSDGDDDYFELLAGKMSHDGFEITSNQLKGSSPKYMEKLPSHATGEFKKDPFEGYTGKALEMYSSHFAECQNLFYP